MLLGGDEFRRTQRGNNNAYCQDNETSWVDWSLCQRNDEIFRFARGVLALRRDAPGRCVGKLSTPTRTSSGSIRADAARTGSTRAAKPGVSDLRRGRARPVPHVQCRFRAGRLRPACAASAGRWRVAVDTAQPSPGDSHATGETGSLPSQMGCAVAPHSGVILLAVTAAG